MKYWLVILLLQLCACTACNKEFRGKKQPHSAQGIIDLHQWDFTRDGPVELSGEWEFHWKEFTTTASTKKSAAPGAARYIRVPGFWNDYSVNGKKLPGPGYATYRLRVILNNKTDSRKKQDLALLVHDMGTAYALFINGKQMTKGGITAQSPALSSPGYWPDVVDFIPDGDEAEITVHVSNYHHRKGGMWDAIILGSKQAIHDIREKRLIRDFFLVGAIFFMACYHLVLFAMRKKDRTYLYFSLICLIIPIRILVTGEYYLLRIFPGLQWGYILMLEYLTVYLTIPLFFMFLQALFPMEFNNKVLRAFQFTGIIFSCTVLIAPSQLYTHFILYFQVVSSIICLYGLYAIIRALIRSRENAVPFMVGFSVLVIAVTNDFLYNNRVILTGYAVPHGLFIFMFSQTFLLSRRFARAFTAVENLSEELEQKNRRLIDLDVLKDEFLAIVSHELKTPLHGIVGMAESMMACQDGPISDDSRNNLTLIAISGKRLMNLINDICDFARLKNKDVMLRKNSVDVKTVADIVIALSIPLIGDKKITIHNLIPANGPLVYADENRLQQIMHNLTSNAVKFTDEGRIIISADVLAGDGEEQGMKISVSDTGIGIAKEKQGAIFESFMQADETISSKYGGAGIGLSVSRQLVRLHGGTLDVESDIGKGSTFSFVLPLYNGQNHEIHGLRDEAPFLIAQDLHRDGARQGAGIPRREPPRINGTAIAGR